MGCECECVWVESGEVKAVNKNEKITEHGELLINMCMMYIYKYIYDIMLS